MILKPAKSEKSVTLPVSWRAFPCGRHLKEQTNQLIAPHLARMFGYHLVKVGELSQQLDTSNCPIKHQVDLLAEPSNASVTSDLLNMPFLEHSIDALVLSQVLDYSPDPHQVLREVNRVLIPGGSIIYVGFNPLSFAGVARFWPFKKENPVWNARFFSSHRIKDWLNLLGLEVTFEQQLAFSGLNRSHFWLFNQWQKLAKRYIPWSGSMYVLIAQKRDIPLSVIKPKWKLSPQLSPAKVSLYAGKQNSSG